MADPFRSDSVWRRAPMVDAAIPAAPVRRTDSVVRPAKLHVLMEDVAKLGKPVLLSTVPKYVKGHSPVQHRLSPVVLPAATQV